MSYFATLINVAILDIYWIIDPAQLGGNSMKNKNNIKSRAIKTIIISTLLLISASLLVEDEEITPEEEDIIILGGWPCTPWPACEPDRS
jgi:hypothetical protein